LLKIPFRCRDALATTLSALYGKLLVVMGIAFPMAEVISTYIPPSFYEVSVFCHLCVLQSILLTFFGDEYNVNLTREKTPIRKGG